MHKPILLPILLLAPLMSSAAMVSCESIRDEISQKIIANGVPVEAFTLEIVPNDQVAQRTGQVVGHCANDTQKIIYMRTDGAEPGVYNNQP